MSLSRRSFLVTSIGALATLPDDVFCDRCECWQLPDHVSADGMAWHTHDGEVYVTVEFTGDFDHMRQVPWPGGPPARLA